MSISSDAPPPKPHLTIRPPTGWVPINLRELWEFRDLLFTLAGRDIRVRYKQTVLGATWVFLQPLIGAGIFTFVFGLLAGMEADGDVPYFAITFAGMLAWTVFSKTLSESAGSMLGNTAMVSKVYFPRMILPLSTAFGALVDFAVALGLLGVLMVIFGFAPGIGFLLMPVWLVLMLMLAMGVGLLASSLMVSYRDVRYILPVTVQFLMYASPVGYTLTALDSRLPAVAEPWGTILHVGYLLNPVAPLLEAFRWSLLGTTEPPWMYVGIAAGVCVAVFLVGAYAFKRFEKRFADVI